MGNPKYAVKVDKELLTEFFTKENRALTEKHFKEIKKVFLIVFIQYYNKYFNLKEDLWQDALCAISARRSAYDPKYSAYNYMFTVFRNELGNKIKQYTKELSAEEVSLPKEEADEQIEVVPDCVDRFKNYILGIENYNYIRIPKAAALPLLVYVKSREKVSMRVPGFVIENPNIIPVLYKIINELLYE